MSDVEKFFRDLLKEITQFTAKELKDLIEEAKADENLFIRHIGELAEEFIRMRANGDITNGEFKELMEDLLDLNKMQYHKLSIAAKSRAQKIVEGMKNIIVDKIFNLL